MQRITRRQIRAGFSSFDNLVSFVETGLGYRVDPVVYDPRGLEIAPRLASRITSWFLLANYPGPPPFQIHLVECNQSPTFSLCAAISKSFQNRHPGYYLFVYTQDYTWAVLLAIEYSWERRPKTGSDLWPFDNKPYFGMLPVDPGDPAEYTASVLTMLRSTQIQENPSERFSRIIGALRTYDADESDAFPDSFFYGLRDWSEQRHEVKGLRDSLGQAEHCLLAFCMAPGDARGIDNALECLDCLDDLDDYAGFLPSELRARLEFAMERLNEAQERFESGEEEDWMQAIQDALSAIQHVMEMM